MKHILCFFFSVFLGVMTAIIMVKLFGDHNITRIIVGASGGLIGFFMGALSEK